MDGVQLFDVKTADYLSGQVGLRVYGRFRFKNIKVVAPDGAVLLEGLPEGLPVRAAKDSRPNQDDKANLPKVEPIEPKTPPKDDPAPPKTDAAPRVEPKAPPKVDAPDMKAPRAVVSIKRIMERAMKKGLLLDRVIEGRAAPKERVELNELLTDLASAKPPIGTAASWQAKTAALLQAARTGNGPALRAAADCAACHREHKGAKQPEIESVLVNSVGTKLVWIPPGKFFMGSPVSEIGRNGDEYQHEVEITRGFWLGAHEVAQSEYQAILGNNPSTFRGAKLPVENISWDDAKEFCRRLSLKEGKPYGLPSEAEWEYACRAGTNSPFAAVDPMAMANYCYQSPYPGRPAGDGLERTVEVGSLTPNALGLYDMHGNVWEFCEDWYGKDYYRASPRSDPQGPQTGSLRVVRGGSWSCDAKGCRSAQRGMSAPNRRTDGLGIRLVLRSEKNGVAVQPKTAKKE